MIRPANGSAIVFQVNAPGSLPIDPFFFLIGLTYCLSVIYAVTLPYADRHPWLIAVQGLGDVVIVTAFIYFTGGITSYFQLLYVLPILGATAVRMQRGARQLALLSALLYGVLVLHQYSGGAGYIGGVFVGDVRPLLPPIRVAIFTVAANAMAFVAVAWLAGSLAERLASADDRLAVTSTALADLQAFNEHVIASLTSGLITTDRAGRIVSLVGAPDAVAEAGDDVRRARVQVRIGAHRRPVAGVGRVLRRHFGAVVVQGGPVAQVRVVVDGVEVRAVVGRVAEDAGVRVAVDSASAAAVAVVAGIEASRGRRRRARRVVAVVDGIGHVVGAHAARVVEDEHDVRHDRGRRGAERLVGDGEEAGFGPLAQAERAGDRQREAGDLRGAAVGGLHGGAPNARQFRIAWT